MRNNQWLSYAALAALACAFVGGCLYLLDEDASIGSGYPAYSSLRADPQGTKVLYESLERVGGLAVSRNYRDLTQGKHSGAALLVLGVPEDMLLRKSSRDLEQWERLANGNRLVISVEPASGIVDLTDARKNSALRFHWGLEFGPPVGRHPEWRRAFDKRESWTELLAYRGKPVIVERSFGNGSVVIAADSRFLSNEALAEQTDASVLARVLGSKARVEFDESHFGITETGGVMALARKYRLQGLLIGLAFLAALFVWKTAAVFPVRAPEPAASNVAGRVAQEGFAGLLRRHIAGSQLVEECLRQWRRTSPRDPRYPLMQVAANADRDPVRAYARIRKEVAAKEGQP